MIHLLVIICAPIVMIVGAFTSALYIDKKLTEYYRKWP
jgi:hypothetical protein